MDILEQLAAKARQRTEEKKKLVPFEEMRAAAYAAAGNGFPFEEALGKEELSFICECKKASPSKGIIADDYDPCRIAKEYEKVGADAVSVLTEPAWFLGNDDHLRRIVRQVSIPVLRKDFTVDAYMIYEAKLLGASAVLLIVSLLGDETIREWIAIADDLGLSCLVETHDEKEIAIALKAGARIIGVNNRNLRDFTVDVSNSLRLREAAGKDILFVAESGIRTREDIKVLEQGGIDAVLIGETLMRSTDKTKALKELKGERT